RTDVDTVSAAAGGTVNFFLDTGSRYAFADYRFLGSFTGTVPRIKLNGVPIPGDYDHFTPLTILYANTPAFPRFFCTPLSRAGSGQMVVPPVPPSLVGLQLDFASFVKIAGKVVWASGSTHLEFVP